MKMLSILTWDPYKGIEIPAKEHSDKKQKIIIDCTEMNKKNHLIKGFELNISNSAT